ncbi:short-chain fatty acid transporter [Sediminicurvatus halobius]|uniref:Serine--pyruvate aminotransferase n=1 Tax=Sediminicurvatus halobius TaxID=2182432 RepID=A0A2U2MXE4_9GAMM|nr:TIGR00366 family protein [Spiribacter halobius]PWG61537.1 serine--pyruvate aminotransferase [Spiribacter halobius]UEX78017.1 TIGR00366 family protein [Spiribacter halobius]
MLQTAGAISARISRRIIPNPFVFAIILSAVVYLLGIGLTDSGPFEMVGHWYDGFWNLLTFSMQMVAILLFGYVLASSPPVRAVISRVASVPRNAGQAVMLVTALAVIFGFISWGLGLIVGAIATREVCQQAKRRGIKVHYPLTAAAGFSGLIIFNCGFSASAPLLVNTEGHFLQEQMGKIPVTETILSPYNLIVITAFLLIIPFVYRNMHPSKSEIEEVPDEEKQTGGETSSNRQARSGQSDTAGSSPGKDDSDLPEPGPGGAAAITAGMEAVAKSDMSLAERLENSRLLTWIIAVAGIGYIGYHFATNGFDLNLNIMNFTLLILGLIAYKTPIAYVYAIDEGIRACGQIVLQFPFYAGIMGMMASSGLVTVFADWMVSVSTAGTFPLAALLSAGVVNLFVPSAGGQWAVQGPVLIEAARQLNVDLGLTVMAFSYGDQLTNGIQPMWMLPLLGITALKAREILGYTAVMMLVAFVIFGVGVTLLPPMFL